MRWWIAGIVGAIALLFLGKKASAATTGTTEIPAAGSLSKIRPEQSATLGAVGTRACCGTAVPVAMITSAPDLPVLGKDAAPVEPAFGLPPQTPARTLVTRYGYPPTVTRPTQPVSQLVGARKYILY